MERISHRSPEPQERYSEAGCLLGIDGGEGVGKTTLAKSLAPEMARLGLNVLSLNEPGGTPLAETVRQALKTLPLEPSLQLYLITAARADLFDSRIRPALNNGGTVLIDRHHHSTFAIQGHGEGLPLDEVRRACLAATGGIMPHLVIYLDLPPDEGLLRAKTRARGFLDVIEAKGGAYHQRVREGFRTQLAPSNPHVIFIDARMPQEWVLTIAKEQLIKRLVRESTALGLRGGKGLAPWQRMALALSHNPEVPSGWRVEDTFTSRCDICEKPLLTVSSRSRKAFLCPSGHIWQES